MHVMHYDRRRRRLWIAGQRCHHGATGVLVAGVAAGTVVATRRHLAGLGALIAAGGMLMAHDWHDRGLWFQPGHQSQA